MQALSKGKATNQTHGAPVQADLAGFAKVYWGFILLPDNSWHFVTPAWSSRVVETFDVRLQQDTSDSSNIDPTVQER